MLMRKLICSFSLAISMAYLPVSLSAWGIVHDPMNYGQMLTTYHQLVQQYTLLQQQFNELKALTDTAKGNYNFGGLLDSKQEFSDRQWSPDDWQQALHGMSGGNPSRYQELVDDYQHNHVILSPKEFEKGATATQAKRYRQDVQVNRAANVNATYAYNNIKKHLDNIHALSSKIDHAENTKAATDLNSRLLAEVAYIQTQSLKMQVLLNQQMAQVNADAIDDKTQRAQFNRLTSK
ncbi:MAG: type IV secretion system protein [Coxiellaceae bacterium]|nr:type IV secretion system protein [Coxiellaceae bacterium]